MRTRFVYVVVIAMAIIGTVFGQWWNPFSGPDDRAARAFRALDSIHWDEITCPAPTSPSDEVEAY